MSKFNTADIEIYSDDSDRKNSDEENQILNLGARKFPKFPKVQFPKYKKCLFSGLCKFPPKKNSFSLKS